MVFLKVLDILNLLVSCFVILLMRMMIDGVMKGLLESNSLFGYMLCLRVDILEIFDIFLLLLCFLVSEC